MEKSAGRSARLGIFVTFALGLFVVGVYYIGQKQRLFNNVFRVRSIFENVSGLQVGNNVRFSGINVGTVEDIEIITDTSVRVDMIVDETARKFIKKDARAVIGSEGLMGNRVINITPGTGMEKMISDNDYILTTKPVSIDAILEQLKTTAENATKITGNMADISSNLRNGKGTLGKLLMDSSLAYNVDQTMVNIKQGAKGFQENMDAAKHSFLFRGLLRKRSDSKNKDRKVSNDKKK
jgi:phospholipid/cholesterol/gamma-HCH transport system substrate-binding protein